MGPLLGYEAEEMIGRKVFEFVHPDDLAQVFATHGGVAGGAVESDASDCRFLHRDGSWHTLSVAGRMFEGHSGDPRIIVNARDVTEGRAAQEALRASEGRYRSFFTLSPDFILIVSAETGKIVDANEAMLERSGLTAGELGEVHFRDLFTRPGNDHMLEAIERLRAGESVRGVEVQIKGPRGENLVFEVNATPLLEQGVVRNVLAMAREITERKLDEEKLKILNAELEGYAQTVSHDLRAPLTAIKLATDHLTRLWERRDRVEDLGAELRRVSEIISESTAKADELISDLLQLARAGQEPKEIVDVNVSDVVARILEEHAPVIEERSVSLEVDPDLGVVRADPTHIYQVFSNLIDNSITHNDSDAPAVEVRYLGRGGSVRGHVYRVCDNGPGIPPGEAVNIFLPFCKGKSGSTGIGLAIVDKLVKLYDGMIRVNNSDGACFEFSLKDR
jgi:PAS domain S-box-containing protein